MEAYVLFGLKKLKRKERKGRDGKNNKGRKNKFHVKLNNKIEISYLFPSF